ncbi:MAG TPA: hypothetical protein VFE54_10920 [Mucilaginibacter sp.]|jgi:hypothetical protein|nr:hypothetical protein [Mucilaginibacter sp.]
MKKITRGWQYAVYDLQNSRVRKQTSSTIFQYLHILRTNVIVRWNIFAEANKGMARVRDMEKASNTYIKSILPIFDAKLLGNPVFLDDGYEQDKCEVLCEIFKNCSVEKGKKIFDSYIQLIHTTWQYGFADAVYNFCVNNGLNAQAQVIQLDFGELALNKADVAQDIANKRWLQNASYVLFPKGELRDYFRDLMDKEITLQKLDELWGAKLPAQSNNQTKARQANHDATLNISRHKGVA